MTRAADGWKSVILGNRRRHVTSLPIAIMATCMPIAAWAQPALPPAPQDAADEGGLSEIIVTAQKREQSLQDVPVSITALDENFLAANRVTTGRDLDALVPNLMVRQQFGASGLPIYTIRGAVAGSTAAGGDRGVAVYIDGVYLATANGSLFEIADLERIEVLRGPQGTLFGRNATGGAISFVTREPSDEFGVRQSVTVGNYGQIRSLTTVNTGTFGAFSAYVSYLHSELNGDIRNLAAGTTWDFSPAFGGRNVTGRSAERLGNTNSDAVMAAVRFEPSGSFKAVYRFDWSDMDMSGEGIALAYVRPAVRTLLATQDPARVTPITRKRPRAVNAGNMVPTSVRAMGHNLTMQYLLTDALSIRNILAYRENRFNTKWTDISGVGVLINTGSAAFAGVLGPALAGSTIGQPVLIQATTAIGSDKQFSNEFQVNFDSDFVTLTAGAIYFRNKQLRSPAGEDSGIGRARSGAFRVYPNFTVPFAGQPLGTLGRPTTVTTKSYAVFAQGEFHVTPELDLVGGIRYTKDKKNGIDQSNHSAVARTILPVDYSDSEVTYSLGANYKVAQQILVYGKYSTGYISGGALAQIDYGPERAKSWEAGVKATWLDNRLRTNLAVFDTKYEDIQATIGGTILTPPRPEITLAVGNLGSAKVRGFELETQLAPADGIELSAGVGYTDFKFTEISPLLTIGNAEILPQNRPDWTLNLSGQYTTEPLFDQVTLTARLDGNWRSKYFAAVNVPLVSGPLVPATSVGFFPASEQAIYRDAIRLGNYWLVNGRVSLDGFSLGGAEASVALWAKNLFDEDAPSFALSLVTVVGYQFERARTVGVDLNIRF